VLAGLGWDTAPRHRAGAPPDLDRAVVGLPPSSPERNPAERRFDAIRRRFEGRVYTTLDAKAAAVQRSLELLAADPPRVRRRGAWGRITTAIATLPEPLANAASLHGSGMRLGEECAVLLDQAARLSIFRPLARWHASMSTADSASLAPGPRLR
jgi:hypothetical protein